MRRCIPVTAVFLCGLYTIAAQADTVKTTDGRTFAGLIVSDDETGVTIDAMLHGIRGKITLARSDVASVVKDKKRGHKPFCASFSRAFFGRPTARSELSTPSRRAVVPTQLASPYGRPRSREHRSAISSFSSSASLTHSTQSRGRSTGQSANSSFIASAFPPLAASELHRQFSARLTSFARSALRSTYRHTVRKCPSF